MCCERTRRMFVGAIVRDRRAGCPWCGEGCQVDEFGDCHCYECDLSFPECESREAQAEGEEREAEEARRRASCDDHRCRLHFRHGQPGEQVHVCARFVAVYDPEPGERVSDYCRRFERCGGCALCRAAKDAPAIARRGFSEVR